MAPAPSSLAQSDSAADIQVSLRGHAVSPSSSDHRTKGLPLLRGWLGHGDSNASLHTYIRSLPTKADFEKCAKRIEKTYIQEINGLKKDLGVHVEDIENTTDGL